MASNRQNNQNINQGRPLRPTLAANRLGSSKPPITPKLAANATTSSNTFPRRTTAPPKSAESTVRPPSSQGSDTPVKAFLVANVTPRSSSRKSRVDSTNTTPTTSADGTPSHSRPRVISPATTEPVVRHSQLNETRSERPPSVAGRPKSTVNGRDAVKGATVGRTPIYLSAHSAAPNKLTNDTSPSFFRANEANSKPQSDIKPHTKPVLRKTPTFLYADGKEENSNKASARSASPVLSAVSGLRSPPVLTPAAQSELTATPLLLSPPLSSISSRTPYFPSPISNSPTFRPPSPPKENIHLSYRKGASQILAHGLQRGPSPSPVSTLPDRLLASATHVSQHKSQASHRKPSLGVSGSGEGHAKSNSLSSIDSGSPNQSRKRSMTGTQVGEPVKTPTFLPPTELPIHGGAQPQMLQKIRTNGDAFRPSPQELIPSPTKAPDLAAEARRERKVLDLEISNSSLLAINRSLEREMKKQKAELKRFRRLSRAGQFAISAYEEDSSMMVDEDGEEEEREYLPEIGADGRPSSPFLEDPDDFSDDDSTASSSEPLSPTAQADKDARVRAEDEERLRLDLSRHRELLMDTQRMNKSLQRCLTWTEDLIKGGRKALDYRVPTTDVRIGGHVLSSDDFDGQSVQADDDDEEENASQADDNESPLDQLDVPDNAIKPDRHYSNDHRVIFGHPSQLRSPLTMARDNPNHAQASFRNISETF